MTTTRLAAVTDDTQHDRVTQRAILAEITEVAEEIRECSLAQRKLIDQRDQQIREAIDEFGISYKQAARAAGLSSGRIHGILAND